MRHIIPAVLALSALVFAALTGVLAQETPSSSSPPLVAVLQVDGAIGPATTDYLTRGFEEARELGAAAVVLQLDTPGGLDASMRDINKAILSSPLPILTYVSPSGARAASAGTYMLYASHIAAMAPGTNLGAATPVQMGGSSPLPGFGDQDQDSEPASQTAAEEDGVAGEGTAAEDGDGDTAEAAPARAAPQDAMSAKMVNDAVAYIRGLAELRDRNAEWAERAVRGAESLSYRQALEKNVVDIVARDIATLLEQASGREVLVNGQPQVLELAGAQLEVIAPDWRSEFLSIITNPNIAFILMLIGIYGLIFEFSNPGALVPGTIGGICLITAFFALDVLPLNYAGLALLILGVALMVAEAFVPSFGILGLGGIVAFAMGATLLFDTEAPGFELSWWVIGSTTAAVALLSMVILTIAVRAQWRPVLGGRQGARGSVGKVVSWSGNRGRVLVDGEVWQATSTAASLAEGQWVQISERRGLVLLVEPNRPPAAYPPV